ncbi:MAG: nucleotidyltransferase family protein [bacterium]
MTIEEAIVLQYAIPRSDQDDTPRLVVGAKYRGQVKWSRVLELALFHDVFPAVYRSMENTGWSEVAADEVRKFRENWHRHLARHLILSHEMNRILETFSEGGVKAIPLKGIFLARLLYPDVTLRAFNDLDIWIRPKDTEMAGELLQKIGYELKVASKESFSRENEYSISFYRYYPYTRIYVDLHWRLAKARNYPALPQERWWQQAKEIRIEDQDLRHRSFFSLAPEDLLIYLTIQIHASSYCYLKQFVDLYQLLIQWGDRLDDTYLYQTAREIGMVNNLLFVLSIIGHLFDTQNGIPGNRQIDIQKIIRRIKPDQHVRPMPDSWRFYLLRHILNRQTILCGRYNRDLRQGVCIFLHDRLSRSITSSLRVLFPSAEEIAARYNLPPHSKKIHLYSCLNPFLIIYWLFRGIILKSTDSHGLGIFHAGNHRSQN